MNADLDKADAEQLATIFGPLIRQIGTAFADLREPFNEIARALRPLYYALYPVPYKHNARRYGR